MTEEEELNQLREMGEDISKSIHGIWQPRCIARAFAWRGPEALRFTMQSWIDLESIQSPLLKGELPETFEDLEAALRAFGWRHEMAVTPEQAAELAVRLRDLIVEAFGMVLTMKPPEAEQARDEIDGFGTWLPVWSCLVVQAGLSTNDALSIEVGRAYALLAGMRRNQGWRVAGTPYALRDAQEGNAAPEESSIPA